MLTEERRAKLEAWAKAEVKGPLPSRFLSLADWARRELDHEAATGLVSDRAAFSPAAQAALAEAVRKAGNQATGGRGKDGKG